jgi:hypothetical protein
MSGTLNDPSLPSNEISTAARRSAGCSGPRKGRKHASQLRSLFGEISLAVQGGGAESLAVEKLNAVDGTN